MRWGDGAARRAVHAVIRRERAKCAGLPSEEREKGPNRGGWRKSPSASVRRASRRRPARSGCGHLHRGDPAIHCGSQHVPPALRRTTGDGGDVRHRRGSPTCSPASTTHPGTARRRLARSALPQSAGHLRPASAQTQRPHRSAIGTAPLPTHTTGHTRRPVHQHLRTAQGSGLAALDPRLPPELVRRSPLAVAWRQFDRALDNFINEAPPPHTPQLGLVVNFTPTRRS